jgi:hypothetical protein
MDPTTDRTTKYVIGCLHAAHGVYMIAAGLGLGVFAWILPTLLVKVVDAGVIDPTDVPRVARQVIEHRHLMPLVALPVIAFGLLGMRRVPPAWLWVVLGYCALLAPAMMLVYTFIVTIGLLYSYQSL